MRNTVTIKMLIIILLLGTLEEGFAQESMEDQIVNFEKKLKAFKEHLKLPGLSAVILKDQKVIWKSGMGYADIENGIKATPQTQYQLASITKPIGSIVLLQQMEHGLLDLEQPISDFDTTLDTSGQVNLSHLITHTSEGESPGYAFNYNGNLYSLLGIPLKRLSGKSFRTLASENIFKPLEMNSTVSNPADPEILERFYSYQSSLGKQPGIPSGKGKRYKLCDLYEYNNRSYGFTYWLMTKLIAGALNNEGLDTSGYIYNPNLKLKKKSQKEFNKFYKSSESEVVATLTRMAKPYKLNEKYELIPGRYSMFFSMGAGHISSVEDLAKLDIALDQNRLISEASKEAAFTAYKTPEGETIPYGLGWFVQDYHGTKLVWHGGEWDCASGLYFKIPSDNLTLIVLSNSRKLSEAFSMGAGDVLNSGVAMEFFRIFYLNEHLDEKDPDIDWSEDPAHIASAVGAVETPALRELYLKQIHVMGMMFQHMGDTLTYKALLKNLKEQGNFSIEADKEIREMPSIAEISEVGNQVDRSVDFSIKVPSSLKIYAIGEGFGDQMFDFGWITEMESGKVVWNMDIAKTLDAGGDGKNRKVDTTIDLPDGHYRLHYKSDDSHSYLNWNSLPPDSWYWGIKIYQSDSKSR